MSIQHITKDTTKRRRFQPPITSFFSASTSTTPNTDDDDENENGTARLSHYHYSAATFSPTPVVPAKVQSSLLSVGMRVRKSVAEGYKTQELEKQLFTTSKTAAATANGTGNHAELNPFCGYSKTEDLAVQAFSRPSMNNEHDLVTDENDAFSLPSSSQGSFTSSLNGGQKRSYDSDDMDDDELGGFDDAVNHTGAAQRTLLAPSLGQQRRKYIAMKNQNRAARTAGQSMDVDDFEEASFLRRREDVEMDGI